MALQMKKRDDLDSLFAELGAEMPDGVVLPDSIAPSPAESAEDPYARFLKKKGDNKDKDKNENKAEKTKE